MYKWWDYRDDEGLAEDLGDGALGWVEYCPNEGDVATSWLIIYGCPE